MGILQIKCYEIERERFNMFEYKFIRLDSKIFGGVKQDYQLIVEEHACQGWRLVQIFAPSSGGSPLYYELIFERPKDS